MPSLDKRVTKVEETMAKHLAESGEIRHAIKTLEDSITSLGHSIGKISDRMWYALWALAVGAVGIIGFLLRMTLWR